MKKRSFLFKMFITCFIINIFTLYSIFSLANDKVNLIQNSTEIISADSKYNEIIDNNEYINNESNEESKKENESIENSEKELESNKYIIDDSNSIIYRVLPETTIDIFKKNFSIPNDVKVYKDKKCDTEVNTGYIGTGMILRNETNNKIYEISVIGDFNADGKITQIELTRIIRHVVGLKEYQLDGCVLKSADINNDNVVNHIDITLVIRYNVYGELDIDENKEVKSPEIQIVEGTEGNNNWYTSNVKLKITPNKQQLESLKTTYKISGSKVVDETEIKPNETITLEEGTYQISAYTYDKSGFKSLATRKTINIDKTIPQVGKLNMWLDKIDGEIYTPNTWTNKNVVLQLKNGSDNESGHASTSYYVKDNADIPEGTTENKTLNSSGIYTAVVETMDNAGNKNTIEYIIKIDKNTIVNPEIKVISGNKNEGYDWYISNEVVLQVNKGEQETGSSNIIKTTYKIEGQNNIEETQIEDGGQIKISENGTYTITAYNYNEAGQKSSGNSIVIKKDDTTPKTPSIEIVEGNQSELGNWYTSDVKIKVKKAEVEQNLSQINKITYIIEGAKVVTETEIEDEGIVTIDVDGTSTIKVYNYNEAGTRSPENTITINRDTIAPDKATISSKDIKSTEFKLVGEASDSTSGIKKYEFYVDEQLINTVESSEENVEVLIQNQTSGTHKAYVVVTDNAGYTKKSEEIDVEMGRLVESDIDYLEFVVTKFDITDGDSSQEDNGVTATISDTSLTQNPKYIMINSKVQNAKGTVEGKIRIVRKDSTIVEDFKYFPENLVMNMSYYANGSGTSFTHEKSAIFFGINLNSESIADGNNVNTNITSQELKENKFLISDKKLTGTQTYTRATIQEIKMGENLLPFRIVQEK